MRNELNNTMKTIWILGAGATISNDRKYPSIMDFFSRGKEYFLINESSKTVRDEYEDLKNYALNYLNKNIMRKNDKIDIEYFLTHLYIEFDNSKNPEIENMINKIIGLIKKVLLESEKRAPFSTEYETLATSFLNFNTSTIITFNWDTLLDKILKSKKTPHYNYLERELSAKYLWGYTNGPKHSPYLEYPKNGELYLKLHGSIDWVTCKTSNCRLRNLMFLKEDITGEYYCSECHEVCNTLIIPPILNKQYNEYPSIKKAWNLAFKEISNSNKIIIWGYGLPPTDFYANWLFSRSTPKECEIIVINPEILTEKRNSETNEFTYSINKIFQKKFSDTFGDRKITYYRYFSDFEISKNIFEKYILK
ncbi:hypothetical protein AB3N58_10145 [Leptospira sp. WS60.C2]